MNLDPKVYEGMLTARNELSDILEAIPDGSLDYYYEALTNLEHYLFDQENDDNAEIDQETAYMIRQCPNSGDSNTDYSDDGFDDKAEPDHAEWDL